MTTESGEIIAPPLFPLSVSVSVRVRWSPVPRSHHADVAERERAWVGSVPVTSPRRTLVDVRRANVSPQLVEQATRQAVARGLIGKRDAARLESAGTS